MKIQKKIILAFSTVSLLLSACANNEIAGQDNISSSAEKAAVSASMSPTEAIEKASLRIQQGQQDNLGFFSPLHMGEARDKLLKAQKANKKIKEDTDRVAVIAMAIEVDKTLDAAYANKGKVQQQLAPSLERKAVVDELGALKLQPKKYQSVMKKLTVLIKELEGGFFDQVVKGQPKLLEAFAELEADSMRTLWLTDAIKMLDKAEDVDADDFAEKSYEKAEIAIKDTNDFIDEYYADRKGVEERSFAAYNLASQAYFIAIEVQKVFKANEEELEDYMLLIQKRFNTINENQQVANLSSYSFKQQAQLLGIELAKALKQNEQPKSKPLDDVEAPIVAKEPAAIEQDQPEVAALVAPIDKAEVLSDTDASPASTDTKVEAEDSMPADSAKLNFERQTPSRL